MYCHYLPNPTWYNPSVNILQIAIGTRWMLLLALKQEVNGHNKRILDYYNNFIKGFLFGPIVALELGLPFIAIRKKGKLPGQIFSANYMV
jgi:hypothetical protein